jgi:hypothetical protein
MTPESLLLIENIRKRWSDGATAASCDACAHLADHHTQEGVEFARSLDAFLTKLARPQQYWRLRECRHCGALFRETWSGPPAADDLFAITTNLERLAPGRAIELLARG